VNPASEKLVKVVEFEKAASFHSAIVCGALRQRSEFIVEGESI
jgi:hypothetical protein